jgi:hypothetical protein
MYGGLGNWHQFTTRDTSHYIAPVASWELNNGITFKLSPTFGLTSRSVLFLLRFRVSYEIKHFGERVKRLFLSSFEHHDVFKHASFIRDSSLVLCFRNSLN